MTTATSSKPGGEPAWDIARLFPAQGTWSEEDYLALPGNHLVEFSRGCVEVLPMPTYSHQLLVAYLYRALLGCLCAHPVGQVIFAPLRAACGRSVTATSAYLDGFAVETDRLFAEAENRRP